jgi:ABC-2 type transport system ATP-binding protein
MSAKVIIQDLRKRYGAVEALRGVSLRVEDGEIFGLIGPNGAGKTTTVECVLGLREPDSGTIELCGIDARRHPRAAKRTVGAALQTTALQDKITPREALALFGAFYPAPASPEALLDRFSLSAKADAPFDSLSGGQRQRLALALAFVHQPDLVFLDEPTAGLDPQARRELHEEITGLKRDGQTVLLTTHDLAEAQTLCDHIAIIDRGRVIASGRPAELTARSAADTRVSLVASAPLEPARLQRIDGIEGLICQGQTAEFRTATPTHTLAALMSRLAAEGLEVTELHVQKATLEDVFIELTGRDEGMSS